MGSLACRISLLIRPTLMVYVCIALIWELVTCNEEGPGELLKSANQQQPANGEEKFGITPKTMGMWGMTGSGISSLNSSQVPKCLGQNMRMEKLTQVTEHCEEETGEGKNDTNTTDPHAGRSLCFTACMWKFLGLIGDDFMFTSGIDTVVIDLFPPIAHWQVKKAVRGCAKASILPLSSSDNCTSFGPVKGCILKSVQNICSGNY